MRGVRRRPRRRPGHHRRGRQRGLPGRRLRDHRRRAPDQGGQRAPAHPRRRAGRRGQGDLGGHGRRHHDPQRRAVGRQGAGPERRRDPAGGRRPDAEAGVVPPQRDGPARRRQPGQRRSGSSAAGSPTTGSATASRTTSTSTTSRSLDDVLQLVEPLARRPPGEVPGGRDVPASTTGSAATAATAATRSTCPTAGSGILVGNAITQGPADRELQPGRVRRGGRRDPRLRGSTSSATPSSTTARRAAASSRQVRRVMLRRRRPGVGADCPARPASRWSSAPARRPRRRPEPTSPTPSPAPSRRTGSAPGSCRCGRTASARCSRPRPSCGTGASRCPTRSSRSAATGFAAVVETVPPDVLARSTWQPGCPVSADDLLWVRLTFWGFDDARHTGELLVNKSAAGDVVSVFRTLYRARYPIEEMRVTRLDELDAPPTGDGNNTGVVRVPADHRADDVLPARLRAGDRPEPVPEPLRQGRPGAARAGLGVPRPRRRPRGDDPARRRRSCAAFAAIGWEWGGDWRTLKDYQHFSQNGT